MQPGRAVVSTVIPFPKPRHALVIGGSLGGLMAAVLLRRQGWQVQVFERSSGQLESRGGGIILQPEVRAVLHRAGVQATLPLGVPSRERLFLDARGSVIQQTQLPQTLSAWSTLYTILREALPEGCYHQGEMLVRLEQNAGGVMGFFTGGHIEQADLLVAADGVNSTVRRLLLPGHEPQYAGYVVYRGLVPEAWLSEATGELLRDRMVFHEYPGSQILQYPVPGEDGGVAEGERRHNWEWYVKTDLATELLGVLTDQEGIYHGRSIPPGQMAEDVIARLHQRATQELPPPFRELVTLTEAPFVQPVLDLAVPQMVFRRVALIGDAAFIARPHTAASTAKAAANAMALLDHLADPQRPVDKALRLWEAAQLQLGQRLVLRGQELGSRL